MIQCVQTNCASYYIELQRKKGRSHKINYAASEEVTSKYTAKKGRSHHIFYNFFVISLLNQFDHEKKRVLVSGTQWKISFFSLICAFSYFQAVRPLQAVRVGLRCRITQLPAGYRNVYRQQNIFISMNNF